MRRKARECALQVLYQMDVAGVSPAEALCAFWPNFEAPAQVVTFAEQLVHGVHEHRDAIDRQIQEASRNWRIDRMATVDRNILRMAIYELLHIGGIPKKVTINEAIEIGKRFGAEDSGAFINGILDHISAEIGEKERADELDDEG